MAYTSMLNHQHDADVKRSFNPKDGEAILATVHLTGSRWMIFNVYTSLPSKMLNVAQIWSRFITNLSADGLAQWHKNHERMSLKDDVSTSAAVPLTIC